MPFVVDTVLCMMIWTMAFQQQNHVSSFTSSSSISSSSIRHTYHRSQNSAFVVSVPSSLSVPHIPQLSQQSRFKFGTVAVYSSFTADGSEYAAGDSDFDTEDDYDEANALLRNNGDSDEAQQFEVDEDDENRFVPTTELQPVPISKNAGNRFVTVIWDRAIKNRKLFHEMTNDNNNDNDANQWNDHYDRIQYTEDHVLFCRKQNLYNTTFNQHSMVDILWSLPM